MTKIDNDMLWASLIWGNSVKYENGLYEYGDLAIRIRNALKEQGLEYNPETKSIEEIEGELTHSEVTKKSDQDKLSEFEIKLISLLQKFRFAFNGTPTNGDILDYVAEHSKELITLARKQIASEIDKNKMLGVFLNELIGKPSRSHSDYYLQGIEDTLKAIQKGEEV